MKKFKWIVSGIIVCYLLLAGMLIHVVNKMQMDQNNCYRVEINRVLQKLYHDTDFEREYPDRNQIYSIEVKQFDQIRDISAIRFLRSNASDTVLIEEFYHPSNGVQYEIVPVTGNDQIIGYVRFNYQKKINFSKALCFSELILAAFVLIVLAFLTYLYRNIIKPFETMAEVPYELSKGNLNLTIKENKNRYFGKFLWGIGMLKDALDLHKKRELKLSRDKKMILLSVSHDIKTPLNAIKLYAKAIEQGIYESDEEKQNAVIRIQEKVEEINGFVQTIVKSSTEEVVSIEVNTDADFYLKDLNRKLMDGFAEKCMLRHMDFSVDAVDNKLIKGDMDRIYEAIGNLIENAFKYGDGKRIRITFSEEEYCQLIHVYNSGIPVDVSEMPHLFESFYRGTNSDGKLGNGLGLYICHEIMKKSNGDMYAQRLSDGMEFVLVCPIE